MVFSVSQPSARAAYLYQILRVLPEPEKLPHDPISPISLLAPVVTVTSGHNDSVPISIAPERLSAPAALANWNITRFSSNPTTRKADSLDKRFLARKRLGMPRVCVMWSLLKAEMFYKNA